MSSLLHVLVLALSLESSVSQSICVDGASASLCPSSTDPALEVLPTARSRSLQKRTSLQDSLFPPTYSYSNGFTTASGVSMSSIQTVQLDDSALNIVKVQSGMTHNVVQENGKTAWEADYPQGSFNPSHQPLGMLSPLFIPIPR